MDRGRRPGTLTQWRRCEIGSVQERLQANLCLMPHWKSRPREISFPHQVLGEGIGGPNELVSAEVAAAVHEPCCRDVGDAPLLLRRAGVAEIILIHGTFAGNDIVGIAREIARFSPRLAKRIGSLGKQWFDELVGEMGNYTEAYADCLSRLINSTSAAPIPITRFHWSGENHHLGRADGVMSLLELLSSRVQAFGGRRLILAHSHGGNLAAMMSQLLVPTLRHDATFLKRRDCIIAVRSRRGSTCPTGRPPKIDCWPTMDA